MYNSSFVLRNKYKSDFWLSYGKYCFETDKKSIFLVSEKNKFSWKNSSKKNFNSIFGFLSKKSNHESQGCESPESSVTKKLWKLVEKENSENISEQRYN